MYYDFEVFYAAARALLSGQSPYIVSGFFSPIWALLPFLPLTFLSLSDAEMVYRLMTTLGILYALYRFRLKPLAVILITFFSPLLWSNLLFANVDWLVLLGASFTPRYGAWLCALKPQMSFGVFGLWAGQRHYKPLVIVAALLLLNYLIFGLPDLQASHSINNGNGYSASLFPVGIPVALYWFHHALKRKDTGLALALSALCSPYYSISSIIALAPLAKNWRGFIGAMILSWLLFFLWRFAILK